MNLLICSRVVALCTVFGLVMFSASATRAVETAIVRDGSVGPNVTIQPLADSNGLTLINESMGGRPGGGVNLFHSFSQFNIGAGDTALFTADSNIATQRVIARVTGDFSQIDGTLASDIAGADFFFLNPQGIVFGQQAKLDVPAAFYASTANSLVMLENDPQGALTFSGDAALAFAEPQAFGFLGEPMSLVVDGATLKVADGATLSLSAGGVEVKNDALLRAPDGNIELRALGTDTLLGINGVSESANGALSVDQSILNSAGSGKGSLRLNGGELQVKNSVLNADLAQGASKQAGTAIELLGTGLTRVTNSEISVRTDGGKRTGGISVQSDDVVLRGATNLFAGPCDACEGGAGGSIEINALGDIRLEQGGGEGPTLQVSTASDRQGGDIELSAASIYADTATVTTFTTGSAKAGSIRLSAEVIELSDGADVQSIAGTPSFGGGGGGSGGGNGGGGNGGGDGGGSGGSNGNSGNGGGSGGSSGGGGSGNGGGSGGSSGGGGSGNGGGSDGSDDGGGLSPTGSGGDVELIATQQITLRQNVNLGANSNTAGDAGSVLLEAPVVEVLNGSRVASTAADSGDGGSVAILATDRVEVSGTNNPLDPVRDRGSRITASSAFTASGDAGLINIATGTLILADGARVSSSTSGVGQGGGVVIAASERIEITGQRGDGSGSSIRAATEIEEDEVGAGNVARNGDAGDIRIQTPVLTLGEGTEIRSTTSLPGNGGTLSLDVGELFLTGARVEANSVGAGAGNAGNVSIGDDTGGLNPLTQLVLRDQAAIETSADDAGGGDILIDGAGSLRLFNSRIDASDTGGEGGNVFVTATKDILVTQDSRILARAAVAGGSGGVIQLTSDAFVQSLDSVVSAENAVVISSPETNVEAQVTQLAANFQDAGSLISPVCAVRSTGEREGSFTVNTGWLNPTAPDAALMAFATPLAKLASPPLGSDGLILEVERLLLNGQFTEASATAQAALAMDSNQPLGMQLRSIIANASIVTDREQAETLFERELANAANSPQVARLLFHRANLHQFSGRTAQAMADYRRSIRMAEQTGEKHLSAYGLAAITRLDAEQELPDQARESAVLALRATTEVTHENLRALLHLAATMQNIDPDLSMQALLRAAEYAEQVEDQYALVFVYGGLAQLHAIAAQSNAALQYARAAILQSQQHAPGVLYRWLHLEAQLLSASGQHESALASSQRAVAALEQQPTATVRYGPVVEFRAELAPIYQNTIRLLLESQSSTELYTARNVFEQFKNAELRDYFHDQCFAALEAKSVALEDIEANTAIVYPILLDETVELLVSVNGRIERYTSAASKQEVVATALALRQSLENRTTHEYLIPAQELYQWLVAPYADALQSAKVTTLVFVPDGALQTAPMAALHDGEAFLGEQFALAITPSLTLLEPKPLATDKARVLLAGVSESRQGFGALPHVPQELNKIQTLIGGEVLINEAFVTEDLTAKINSLQPNIVHIASHAEFTGDSSDSFLLTYNGTVNMDQLYGLVGRSRFREPLELITLSACETAAGDERAALGLAGTAIRAGARSALGTLWSVSDEASETLLVNFYQALGERDSKADALRRAQRAMLDDPRFSHPYYWAPYLLISNWL